MLIKTSHSVEEIRDDIFDNDVFGTPKYSVELESGSRFYVFEEWTFRNGNYMTISIVIENKEDFRLIHYVAGGAARGILGIEWGAESSRENRLIDQLDFHNFDYQILDQ